MPRDSNGNYSLPASVNPVVSGTTITSNWANTTLVDIAQGITDSLDRSGRGGMLAPFRLTDGSVALPGLAFTNETSTGISRPSAGRMSFSVTGTEVLRATATALSAFFPLTLTAPSDALNIRSGSAAQYVALTLGRTSLETYFGVSGGANQLTINDVAGDTSIRVNTGALFISTAGGASRLKMTQAGEFGLGVTPVATVPLMVHTGSNRNFAVLDQGSSVTISGMTDAGSSAKLRVVGNTLEFSGTGSGVQATLDPAGNFSIGTTSATHRIQGMYSAPELLALFRDLDVTSVGTAGAVIDIGARNGATPTAGARILGELDNPATTGALSFHTRTGGALTKKATIDSVGRLGVGRIPDTHIFEAAGAGAFGYTTDQAVRLIHNDAYLAFWNTAQSVRSGYLQMLSTGVATWANEVGGAGASSSIRVNGSNRLTVTGGGIVNITAGSGSLQLNGAVTRAESNPAFAINAGFSFTIPRRPDAVRVALECITAEAGYVAGQTVEIPPSRVGYTGGYWTFTNAASTQLTVQIFNATFQIPSTTGVATNVTPANWSLRVTALFL